MKKITYLLCTIIISSISLQCLYAKKLSEQDFEIFNQFCHKYLIQYRENYKNKKPQNIKFPKQIQDIIAPFNKKLFLDISNAIFSMSKPKATRAIITMQLEAQDLCKEEKQYLYELIDIFLTPHVFSFINNIKQKAGSESFCFWTSHIIHPIIFSFFHVLGWNFLSNIFFSSSLSKLLIPYNSIEQSIQKQEKRLYFIKTFIKEVEEKFLNEKSIHPKENMLKLVQSILEKNKNVLSENVTVEEIAILQEKLENIKKCYEEKSNEKN